MTLDDLRIHVRGEDAPHIVPFVFGLAGIAGAALTVLLVVSSAEAARPSDDSRPAAPVPAVASTVVVAPAASSSAPEPASCPPLVVSFAFASASLDASEAAAVDKLAAWLITVPEANVLVHGHADAFGKDDTNLAFSRSRALAVSSRLTAAGVARARITARGFGAYQPVEGAPEEASSNRRAVVYVKGVPGCPTSAAGERR